MKLSEVQRKSPKVLVFSPAGGGKTALALTCGKYAQVLDLDDGLVTGLTLKDSFQPSRLEVDVKQFLETDPSKAQAFLACKSYVAQVASECVKGVYPFSVLVIDSFTALADFAVRMVLANSGALGKAPQIQHWGIAFTELENFMLVVRSLPIAVVLTAHEARRDEGDESFTEIAIPGKNLPSKVRRFFDEIWFMRTTAASGGKTNFTIQTRSTARVVVRSRENLEDGLNANLGMPELFRRMGYDITVFPPLGGKNLKQETKK